MTTDEPSSAEQSRGRPDQGGHAAERLREQMQRDLGGIPAGHDPGSRAAESTDSGEDDEREQDGAGDPSGEGSS